MENPTHCDRCGACFEEVSHGSYCQRFQMVDGEFQVTETICPSCDYKELITQYAADGVINATLSRQAAMYHHYAHERLDTEFTGLREDVRANYKATGRVLESIHLVNELVQAKVREFEIRNWLPTVKRQWLDAGCPLSGENDVVNVKVWGSAGRVLITVQKPGKGDGDFHVTMIFDESADYPRAGVHAYLATREEALELMDGVINHFPALVNDDNVCFV